MAWFRIGGVRIGSYKRGFGGSIRGKKFGFGGSIDLKGIGRAIKAKNEREKAKLVEEYAEKAGLSTEEARAELRAAARPKRRRPPVATQASQGRSERSVERDEDDCTAEEEKSRQEFLSRIRAQAGGAPQLEQPAAYPPGARPVSLKLGIGIFFLPLIFAWFTLRKGYSAGVRFAAFSWMISLHVLVNLAGRSAMTTSPQEVPASATTPASSAFDAYGTRLSPPSPTMHQRTRGEVESDCLVGKVVEVVDKKTGDTHFECRTRRSKR